MNNLVLSIFPGIDLLGRAFEEEGFCVVRGPDLLWGGDIKTFHPPAGVFDGVIGGPPCKGESNLAYLNGKAGETMSPEFHRVVAEARPDWWLMEAVKRHIAPYVVKLSPRYLGEKQSRRRFFHSNLNIAPYIDVVVFEHPEFKYCVRASNRTGAQGTHKKGQSSYTFKEMCELQGLPGGFDLPGFLMQGKFEAIGNGVPLSMGRAVAKGVKKAIENVIQNKEELDA